MKEASGELNMTLVTIIAIGAILLFATTFVPAILKNVGKSWDAKTQDNMPDTSYSDGSSSSTK